MSNSTAYELTNEKLIREFMRVCEWAGTANSGLAIDCMAGSYLEDAHYLKGVVLSRLDGKIPPFKRGNVVRAVPGIGGRVFPTFPNSEPRIDLGRNYTVSRVHYRDDGRWFLEFRGLEGNRGTPHYDAKEFKVV
jgi:hypothetical protein